VANKTREIYDHALRHSPHIRQGNFDRIAPTDLSWLFDRYDDHFFTGQVRQMLHLSRTPLSFALSARLTRAAGQTKRFFLRRPAPGVANRTMRYEIAISTTLLFQTFQDIHRPVHVNGLACKDRPEALLRIFEHEVLHLIEMVIWNRSSCAASNFKTLAWNYFAHTETKHDLVTQHERASTQFDVRVGDRVAFEFEGTRRVGVVNRITRRATVLVEDGNGMAYSDGKCYQKFYIPLSMLEKVP